MKAIKEYVGGFLVCLMEVIIGILLLIDPIQFTGGIITVCGMALVLAGLWLIIKYFMATPERAALGQNMMKGLTLVALGGFVTLRSDWILATFPLMALVYGVVILLFGFAKVQQTVDMLRVKNKKWTFNAVSAGISLVCAVVILSRPFSTTAVLWSFTGITLIAEAVLDVVTVLLSRGREQTASGEAV